MSVPNSLLAALPHKDYQRLLVAFQPVTLVCGDVLYEPGKPILHVYFPGTAMVSLLTRVDRHPALEIGLIGSEGMIGMAVALGVRNSPVRALVLSTGSALRMTSARFRSEHRRCKALREALDRYIHDRIRQLTQAAACNRFHPLEGRLARWLLMARDRVGAQRVRFTQASLGDTLGVLRVAVTKSAGALQRRKLISYSRGRIEILDHRGLEAAACSCYQVVERKRAMRSGRHRVLRPQAA